VVPRPSEQDWRCVLWIRIHVTPREQGHLSVNTREKAFHYRHEAGKFRVHARNVGGPIIYDMVLPACTDFGAYRES
jgi:hypothetical protein